MRPKFILLFVTLLVCFYSAGAQSVIESESRVILQGSSAKFSLAIENLGRSLTSRIELALIDEKDQILAETAQFLLIKPGKAEYKIAMPLGVLLKGGDESLPWYRLRYVFAGKTGFISLSELLKDIFELRIAAAENIFPGMRYRVRVRAIQAFTKQPVKGVQIDGELKLDLETDDDDDELKLTGGGKTDGDGFAILDFDIPAGVKLDYRSEIKITGTKDGIIREIEEDLEENDSNGSVFLTADKPIYQPGQAFNVRGLYFDANNNVMPDSELEFRIKDENDTVLYQETVKTSAYGIASISWRIPENAKLGAYNVTVDADKSLEQDRLFFNVSRYDLPQFTVEASSEKKFYLPAQNSAKVTVSASYLFGKPVAKGRVRIVQEIERHWNWEKQKYDFDEAQSFEGETNPDGSFIALVDLSKEHEELKDNKWNFFNDLNFSAYFTDPTTNRTEQKRFDIRITKSPIHVYLMRYEDNNVNLPVNGYLSTFYADGRPAVCDILITGEGKPVAKLKTNSLGAGRFSFEVPKEDAAKDPYHLKIIARDKNGQTGAHESEYEFSDREALTLGIEKAILNTAENIRIDLRSSKKEALVYVDVIRERSVVGSYTSNIKNGKGSLEIPYLDKFKGELTVAAYYYDEKEQETIRIARGVIYPAPQNLELNANFSGSTYRPGEEVKINFSVLDGIGKAAESALGVVVFDKAVEERARTDSEFGSYFSRFYSLLGYNRWLGDISIKDINELDLTKPVSPELQLAAEIMLADSYYSPRIHLSSLDQRAAGRLYSEYFKKQFVPVEKALAEQYAEDYAHPIDEASLKNILSSRSVRFDDIPDPWGQNYVPVFTTQKTQHVLMIKSNGADKKPGTSDDVFVFTMRFDYFTPTGIALDKAVSDYHKRTGHFIHDLPTLTAELALQGIDLNTLKDSWGWNYRITFEISGRNYLIRFHSDGADAFYDPDSWSTDDFDVWKSYGDYFSKIEFRINEILTGITRDDKKPFPADDVEFTNTLKRYGVEIISILDAYGEPVYLQMVKRTNAQSREETLFIIKSKGPDRMPGYDDFELGAFSSLITDSLASMRPSRSKIRSVGYTGNGGAITGVLVDANGAVIPNAKITVSSQSDPALVFTTASNSDGEFSLEDIPPGLYQIRADSPGFKSMVTPGVNVQRRKALDLEITMEAAGVSEVVTVTAEAALINSTQNTVGTTIRGTQNGNISFPSAGRTSTPRLREYFPETLLWNPELVTDKKGKAELKFKLADSITTWKFYAIASTKKGKIGISEKEITAFQPFFVDLDPPKFLTAGDEISLPVTVRNYTEKKQNVAVSMARGDWFSFLGQGSRQVAVEPNAAQNTVFGFKALMPVKDGKQRVTAIAQKESDAVEKPVTVRPDGKEIVRAESKVFRGTADLNIDFPANALPQTASAELKLYPNLISHVSESVEGLLKRPYGCGEQTVSSTYPNLMILKFSKTETKLRRAAQTYLQKGYERLLTYQAADGGFNYWIGDSHADLALTAYAVRFLSDAGGYIDVDESALNRAQAWLARHQRADGSWAKDYYDETPEGLKLTRSLTGYIARVLSMSPEKSGQLSGSLSSALTYLKAHKNEITDPYSLAQFGLALSNAGDITAAQEVMSRLEKMALLEKDTARWNANGSTPFNGWGAAATIETTALVTQLLIKLKAAGTPGDDLLSRATMYLLKSKDRYGVWYSTQTTINVLDAFLLSFRADALAGAQPVQIFINGAKVREIAFSPDQIAPLVLDLTGDLGPAENRVEIRAAANLPLMFQAVSTHYIDWKDAQDSPVGPGRPKAMQLAYNCDKQNVGIMQEVNCSVEVNRTGRSGEGMLLAEIGTPPGADVSRESLQKALESGLAISRYDILPDRIVLYLWARRGGTKFNFSFRPRYGINAQTPPSIAYDYYNPEAQAAVAPLRFSVK